MASEITKRTPECVVCALQHHTTQSSHWCIECEEPLCAAFKQHHTILKATRNHKTIPIFDYLSLLTAVTDIKQHCVYHNEKYQLYCVKHESQYATKPYGVFDVACLDDSTVAISTRFSMNASGISLVKLTKRKVIQFIDLPDSPYGMTYDGKSLICYVEDEDLHVISCTDYSITTIPYTASPYLFIRLNAR
ncbi:unnamed protein product [Mytilus edulis]|uniref:B box-type domain-containing protein n=1 Tax=Mytilus edulis TaxID=6550 RepID=A0A8S3V051_MYTED|nr:unnamed protein product [Mytilus edulis]